jgi:uncharacterized protein (DUF1501 family)
MKNTYSIHRTVQQGLANLERREFLRRGTMLSAAGIGAPLAMSLASMTEAVAASPSNDYKALVCVFLYGANDHYNTTVPYDSTNHASYINARGTLGTARSQLLSLASTTGLPSGTQMSLAPQLTGLKTLFDAGRMGVLLNIGPLIHPTTLAQYRAKSVPLPPKLFSHNDQQSVWQSSLAEGATSGWGGRLGDRFLQENQTSTFTCMNLSGNAVFMSGKTAVQYQVGTAGAVKLSATNSNSFGSNSVSQALQTLTQASSVHLFENEHTRLMKRAVDVEGLLTSNLPSDAVPSTPFDTNNRLAMQLRMVARTIAARTALGNKRQVFFVSIGGFDNHDRLVTEHPTLLASVDSAIKSFYDATVELGVANQVTTFTASDFGRTLSSNGDGSDHGWGSHHFVIGGAVSGNRFFGSLPSMGYNTSNDVGQGRLLPTTSVEQLGAPLASWFGVPSNEMSLVFPNSGNFNLSALPLFV